MSAPAEVRYVLSEDAVVKRVGGSGAVYLRSNGSLHVLNRTGEAIVRGLEEPATAAELAAALVEASGATPADVERDIGEFLPKLVDLGLLVEA
jgi:PqqD family protein of HPr-rel-A system